LTLRARRSSIKANELAMTNYPLRQDRRTSTTLKSKNAWKAEVLTRQVTAEDYIAKLAQDQPRQLPHAHAMGRLRQRRLHHRPKAWLGGKSKFQRDQRPTGRADPDSVYHYFQQLIRAA